MATSPANAHSPSSERFLKNVLWTWVGGALTIFVGLVLSPYVIRKLGPEGYGLWALLYSLVGYYGLLDLGVRSSIVRYTAYFHASGDMRDVNELINTVIAYYTAGASILVPVSFVLSRYADRIFNVSPAFSQDFSRLVIVVGLSAMIGINVFAAALQGLGRFELCTRISVVTIGIRSIGAFLLLYFGFGLFALGVNVLAAQILSYGVGYVAFRRALPEFRLSFRLARFRMLRRIWDYSAHTFVANIAVQLLNQSPAVLIGLLRPAALIGYFSFPSKLIQYSADFIQRVGDVSHSAGTALAARGDAAPLRRLAIYANRYCLILFAPLGLFFIVYGRELLRVWISPDFAANSAAALLPLVLAGGLAMAAQFNSSALLYSLGEHRRYSRALLVEAAFSISCMAVAIPPFGVAGAAWGFSIPMIAIRGFVTPWLLARALRIPYAPFLRAILAGPLLAAVPVYALATTAKHLWLPGANWPQLILGGAAIALLYWGVTAVTSIEPEHRRVGVRWAAGVAARARGPFQRVQPAAEAAPASTRTPDRADS